MEAPISTYSFSDVLFTLNLTSQLSNVVDASIALGANTGYTDGGISIVMTEDKSTMVIGADGAVMHNLHSGRSATVTIRLLKTSPMNAVLSDAYARQTSSSKSHGRNNANLMNLVSGDNIKMVDMAFAKFADLTYGKEGAEMVWTFHAGQVAAFLGQETPVPFEGILSASMASL